MLRLYFEQDARCLQSARNLQLHTIT